MTTICVDFDGVLYETQKVLKSRLKSMGYKFNLNNILVYDFNKSLNDIGRAILRGRGVHNDTDKYLCDAPREKIFEILADPTIYSDSVPLTDDEMHESQKGISLLKEMMANPKVKVIITTVCYTDEIAKAKEEYLKRVFPDCDYEFQAVKEETEEGKPIPKGTTYIIEDNVRVAKQCSTSITASDNKPLLLLVRKPWNNPHFDSTLEGDDVNKFNVLINSLYDGLKYIESRR